MKILYSIGYLAALSAGFLQILSTSVACSGTTDPTPAAAAAQVDPNATPTVPDTITAPAPGYDSQALKEAGEGLKAAIPLDVIKKTVAAQSFADEFYEYNTISGAVNAEATCFADAKYYGKCLEIHDVVDAGLQVCYNQIQLHLRIMQAVVDGCIALPLSQLSFIVSTQVDDPMTSAEIIGAHAANSLLEWASYTAENMISLSTRFDQMSKVSDANPIKIGCALLKAALPKLLLDNFTDRLKSLSKQAVDMCHTHMRKLSEGYNPKDITKAERNALVGDFVNNVESLKTPMTILRALKNRFDSRVPFDTLHAPTTGAKPAIPDGTPEDQKLKIESKAKSELILKRFKEQLLEDNLQVKFSNFMDLANKNLDSQIELIKKFDAIINTAGEVKPPTATKAAADQDSASASPAAA